MMAAGRVAGETVDGVRAVAELTIAGAVFVVVLTVAALVARGALKQMTIKAGNMEATLSTTAAHVEQVAYQVQRNGGASLADKVHETHRQLTDVVGGLHTLTRRVEELAETQTAHADEMRNYRLVTDEVLAGITVRCRAIHTDPNEGVL